MSRLKEIIQPPPTPHTTRWNLASSLKQKVRYTEIYRHLLLKCFSEVVLGRQEMVQCKNFSWHQTETYILAAFWEHVIFNFKRVEIRKISWVLATLYFKMSDLFGWFLLALRFSATNSGINKTLMMSTGTCGLRLYARKNIFEKRITNMRFWIIYSLVQVSFFAGLL